MSSPGASSSSLPGGLQPLPKGAMSIQNVERVSYNRSDSGIETPPATPSQRLLDPVEAQESHVQFATYRQDNEKPKSWRSQSSPRVAKVSAIDNNLWVPIPLRLWFWIPFVSILLLGAIGLEIAFHFSNKNQGWPTKGDFTKDTNVLHYVYTLPPVIVAAMLVTIWTLVDIEIKKLQPYVDLVDGDSPPERSLFLDYTRKSNFLIWFSAGRNRHYLVVFTSLMVLLCLTFQPLASSLLQVRDAWLPLPDVTVSNTAAIGLNQNLEFDDLSSFLTAAGYASASVLYNLPEAPFVHGQYTVTPFSLPPDIIVNSTVLAANTSAIKSDASCRPVTVDMVLKPDGTGWTNSASLDGCSMTWNVDHSAVTLFGADILNCTQAFPPQFAPVVFWFFTYQPSAMSSATFCYPTFTLWDVHVNLDLASGNITNVQELRTFTSASNFSESSANVTGPPLNGNAYNGIRFNLINPDIFVLARQNATQLQMPAAVYQAAIHSPEGLVGSFQADQFVGLTQSVYTTYLTLIARTVYFLPASDPNTIQIKTVQKRLFLSTVSTHLLAAAMILLAICATVIQLIHRERRRGVRLRHEPGTIASAVSIGGQTGMGELLAGTQNPKEMFEALQDRKFRIDSQSMKIVMEGEDGYEWASSPMDRRRSVFASLQSNRTSRRLSKIAEVPKSPTSPRAAKAT
ncbi:hypothetical protein C8J56DRAFT_914511 [Mycena floridula]|nr:hypothetical protein C8J56DRAFT_914511 [Mycena floridula]